MSDRKRISPRVDADLWQEFRDSVEERKGQTRGVLGDELENAIRQYLGKHQSPALTRMDKRLNRIEQEIGAAPTDGGVDTVSGDEHTHAPSRLNPDEKPAANAATEKKVAYLAGCVLDEEVPHERELDMIPRDTLVSVVKDEYGFRADTAKRYVDSLIDYFDLKDHPHNDTLLVSEDRHAEILRQEVDEADELYSESARTDGSSESDSDEADVDRGDGPVSDGGRSEQPDDSGGHPDLDKSPGQEGYWSEMSDHVDQDGEEVPPDVRDRIVDQLDHETIHGIVGSVRRGETSYLLVVYSQERPSGSVSQIRTVAVEPDAGTVKITDNGIWIPDAGGSILSSLSTVIQQAGTVVEHDLDAEPMTRSSRDVDLDELLPTPMITDEYRRPDEWGRSWGNGNGEPPEVWDLVDRLDEAGLPTQRFSRLEYGAKTPHERYGFRPASDLMGNYGVETGLPAEADPDEMDDRVLRGDQLVVVDVDYPEEAPLDQLPETYAVSSANGSDERAHHYYRVPDKMDLHEALGGAWKAQPEWGDVWLAGEYVVGPGCYDDDSGGRYEVVADRPIETVESDELLPLIQSDEDDLDDDPDEEVADQDDNPEGETDETDEDDDDEPEIVECYRCDEELSKEAATFDVIDGAARWIHPGGCDDE
jgi:hypothetical protein